MVNGRKGQNEQGTRLRIEEKSGRHGRCKPSKQCGGTAGPALALFFGDFFEVADVRPRLCQHVMQIVADADKGKTFVEEFADA